MSELKLISPMLDNLIIGDAINDREGLKSYPAIRQDTDEKYILKVISVPSSPAKLEALLLSGAYADEAAAMEYFRELADEISQEVNILKQLSELEGFASFEDRQLVEKDDGTGYDIYLLSPYQLSLERQFSLAPLTHLAAVNLGLDLCAALTVAERAGYLYTDLRPDNIYITPEGHYKIGDMGFVRLDSLKYAALPDRYRSAYTAPEARDAYASLNKTMAIYALGLILYRVYNNGMLPSEPAEGETIAPPQYADYEMSEIILKACAIDPANRWESPMELGQAIVSYMQRNGISDEPIIPIPVNEEPAAEIPIPETAQIEQTLIDPETTVEYAEDDFGNLSFLDDTFTDDAAECEPVPYSEVSDEVSEMLEQADDLAAHSVPAPITAPEPVDVALPTPVSEEETEECDTLPVPDTEDDQQEPDAEDIIEDSLTPAKKSKWLRNTIIVLMILAMLAVGVYFFLRYYIAPIDSLRVEGRKDKLIVYVDTDVDESLLSVECSYPEGTSMKAKVEDGKAVFEGLTYDTDYVIKVSIEGFHKLTGETSTTYATQEMTSLLHFEATTGITDGSIILDFAVTGPESEGWKITYWTTGEAAKIKETTAHRIMLEGLTVGKLYYFELTPTDDLFIDGNWVITALARKSVCAENIVINSFSDGKLIASWSAPDGEEIASWTVRCYNAVIPYDKVFVVNEPSITIDNIDTTQDYVLEIVAGGMTMVSPRVPVIANSIHIENVNVQVQNNTLRLTLESEQSIPSGSWITYTVNDDTADEKLYLSSNSVVIPTYVPGAKYVFSIHHTGEDGATGFTGMPFIYLAEPVEELN